MSSAVGSRFWLWPRRSLAITPPLWFPSSANFKGLDCRSLNNSMGWAGSPGVRSLGWIFQVHTTDTPVNFLIWPSLFPRITFLQSLLRGQGPTWACLWHAWLEQRTCIGQWHSLCWQCGIGTEGPCILSWIWMWEFIGHIWWEGGKHPCQSSPNLY